MEETERRFRMKEGRSAPSDPKAVERLDRGEVSGRFFLWQDWDQDPALYGGSEEDGEE